MAPAARAATTMGAMVSSYGTVYAFGDSLSDAGNAYLLTSGQAASLFGLSKQPVSPPYYQQIYNGVSANVFSNGPVWTQDLSLALGVGKLAPSGVGVTGSTLRSVLTPVIGSAAGQAQVEALATASHASGTDPYIPLAAGATGGTDFAIGGAVSGPTAENTGAEIALTDLAAQLGTFNHNVPTPAANALATVSIGSDDLLGLLEDPAFASLFGAGTTISNVAATKAGQAVAQSVSNEASFLGSLVQLGVNNILVLNVPDLGKAPQITQRYPNETAAASVLSKYYDTLLSIDVASLNEGGAHISIEDAYSLVDNAIASPASFGLKNVSSPIWSGPYDAYVPADLVSSDVNVQNTYLFFDHLHPTETGHRGLAQNALMTLGVGSREVALRGSSSQYVIADDGGSLYVNDTVAGRDGAQILPGTTLMRFTDGSGVFDPTGSAEDVARIYLASLGRAPDVNGLEFWAGQIDSSHVPLSAIANDFAASPEFIQHYGALSDADYINQLYQNVLARPGDSGELQYWDGVLASGGSRGDVLLGFSESFEFQSKTLSIAGDTNNAEAYRMYIAGLGRAPDPGGEAFWSSQLANDASQTRVAQSFVASTEFQEKYGRLSASDFVSNLYQNLLHHPGDAGGQQFWTSYLQQGGSQASVLVSFSDSLENRTQTAGATHANWVFIPA
jgi:phospholipase/lecithinase/hemolysin